MAQKKGRPTNGEYDRIPLSDMTNIHLICKLGDIPGRDIISTTAFILDVGPLVKTKSKGANKRVVTIGDDSEKSIELVLWRVQATKFNKTKGDVITIKSAHVTKYQGIYQLVATSTTRINLDSGSERSAELQSYWTGKGENLVLSPLYDLGLLRDALKNLDELTDDQRQYFIIDGHMEFSDDDMTYLACVTCNKKTEKPDNGTSWRCGHCQENSKEPYHRYIIKLNIADEIEQSIDFALQATEMTAFDGVGNKLFGMTADDLLHLKVCYYLFFFP